MGKRCLSNDEEHALELQCMYGLAREARSMRERLAERKEASEFMASKFLANRRTADMKVAAGQASTEHMEHTDRIVALQGDLQERRGKLENLERRQ